ncbi:MAG: type II toxin-antitoxin system RelE/ParE family toxin [Bacteroidia bacterium]
MSSKLFDPVLSKEVIEFLSKIDTKAANKIFYNIEQAKSKLDPKFFKKLTNEIWEFRTLFNKVQYRILAFWDKEEKQYVLVFATHGFIKKTQKTPRKEIDKAIKIKERYFKEKHRNDS